eukprot:ANDGO_02400.mRNA.1 Ankyrin repeat and KH domain-containing protein mask
MLRDRVVDVECCDHLGNTGLLIACQNGHLEIAKVLLQHGADCDMRNNAGNTALHFSFAFAHMSLAEYLLSAGASEHIRNSFGLSCREGLNPNRLIDSGIKNRLRSSLSSLDGDSQADSSPSFPTDSPRTPGFRGPASPPTPSVRFQTPPVSASPSSSHDSLLSRRKPQRKLEVNTELSASWQAADAVPEDSAGSGFSVKVEVPVTPARNVDHKSSPPGILDMHSVVIAGSQSPTFRAVAEGKTRWALPGAAPSPTNLGASF